MPPMLRARQVHLYARLVLVWFFMAICASVASPLIKPENSYLVCSASGGAKLLRLGDNDGKVSAHGGLDCPLCLSIQAPPPAAFTPEQLHPFHAPRLLAYPTGMPRLLLAGTPPVRGPPALIISS